MSKSLLCSEIYVLKAAIPTAGFAKAIYWLANLYNELMPSNEL
ncbi:hypothetical protein [Nostoc sp. PA-18-2419]|nr:hypothetical protein [Nostoc sp. PA-18-2419]